MIPDKTLKREAFLELYNHNRPYNMAHHEYFSHAITNFEDDIASEISQERAFQLAKWGDEIHHPFKFCTILGEEYGEACKAALENDIDGYRAELIQVAAVAVRMIQAIDREDKR